MDATVATGAAAMMAIRVLLDHDVPEENILIVSLLMAEIGKQDLLTYQWLLQLWKLLLEKCASGLNDLFKCFVIIGFP